MCKVYNGAVQKCTSYMPKTLENTHFLWDNIIKKIMKERLSERQTEKKSVGAFFYFFYKMENLPKHIKDIKKEDRHEIYEKVKAGEIKHAQMEAATRNLKRFDELPEEEAYKLRRKGWASMMKIKEERKTARECLNTFLPLVAEDIAKNPTISDEVKKIVEEHPELKVTQYDLIYLAMIAKAQSGNVNAATFIRDTAGDKPINESHTVTESISINDKELLERVAKRLNIQEADYREIDSTSE